MEFFEQIDRAVRQLRLGVSIASAVAAACISLGIYVQLGETESVSFFQQSAVPDKPAGIDSRLIDLSIGVEQDLGRLNFFSPDAFRRIEQTVASLQLVEGQQSLDLQRRLGVLLDLRQRLLMIREAAPEAAAQANSMLDRSLSINKRFSADDPIIKPVLTALEGLRADSLQIAQPDAARVDPTIFHANLKAFMASFNEAIQAVKAGRATERQKEFVVRVEKISLVRLAPDWESAVFALLAITEDLAKTVKPLAGASPSAPPVQPSGFVIGRETLARSLLALGFLSLLIGVVIVFQQTAAASNAARGEETALKNGSSDKALSVVSENLNYLKLVTKQLSELGRSLAVAIKKLAKSSSEAYAADTHQQASEPSSQNLVPLKASLQDLSSACLALREQSIQLSILLSEESAAARALDSSDRLVEQLEHIEGLAQRINQEIIASGQSVTNENAGAGRINQEELLREIEGVLVLVSQWQRQFDRLGLAVDEIGQTVEALGTQSDKVSRSASAGASGAAREPSLG
jgi:hypothetical protein